MALLQLLPPALGKLPAKLHFLLILFLCIFLSYNPSAFFRQDKQTLRVDAVKPSTAPALSICHFRPVLASQIGSVIRLAAGRCFLPSVCVCDRDGSPPIGSISVIAGRQVLWASLMLRAGLTCLPA